MSWQPLDAPARRALIPKICIKAGIDGQGLILRMNDVTRSELGIDPSTPLRVLVGSAESAGKIRLDWAGDTHRFAIAIKKSLRLRIGRYKTFRDIKRKAELCDHEVVARNPLVIEVALPAGFTERLEKLPTSGGEHRARDVTSNILGPDGNRGRRRSG